MVNRLCTAGAAAPRQLVVQAQRMRGTALRLEAGSGNGSAVARHLMKRAAFARGPGGLLVPWYSSVEKSVRTVLDARVAARLHFRSHRILL